MRSMRLCALQFGRLGLVREQPECNGRRTGRQSAQNHEPELVKRWTGYQDKQAPARNISDNPPTGPW